MILGPISDIQPEDASFKRVIPRDKHHVSRKNIDREALKVLYRLRDAGFTAYLVGGGVRDLYLGKAPKDFDICTNSRPGQIRKLFKNSRIIGRRFRLVQIIFRGGRIIEASTFRSRGEFTVDGQEDVLLSNNTFGTPREDAFRRDLTINSLFYDIESRSIIDFTGGVEDLDLGIVRMIGEPQKRIVRDPVRMMRAIRHASRNGFTIEAQTWDAIVNNCDKLALCPVSRIRDELYRDLRGNASAAWARLAYKSGLLFVLFPYFNVFFSNNKNDGQKAFNQLLNILSVIDRYQINGIHLTEPLILSLITFPWFAHRFDFNFLLSQKSALASFQKEIKSLVGNIFSHLEFSRSVQEHAATILGFFPLFSQQKNKWPKRVKSKSYFNDCQLFIQLIREAEGGPPVDCSLFVTPVPQGNKSRTSQGKERLPAFATKSKNGIFGFRK